MIKKILGLVMGHLLSRGSSIDLAKLKLSYLYVKIIKTQRLLFLSFLGICVGVFLLMASFVLIHATIFMYVPWSDHAKMIFGFTTGFLYLILMVVILTTLFSEQRWMKIFHAEQLLKYLNDNSTEEEAEKAK